MRDPGCALIWIIGWLVLMSYLNFRAWAQPDATWKEQRGRIARARSQNRNSILIFFSFDPWGFENNRERFIWFQRIALGILLVFGLLALAAAIWGPLQF